MVGTTHVETNCSPFLHLTKTCWVEPKSQSLTDFHWSNVRSLFLAQALLFFLLFFLSSGFFAEIRL